MFTMSVGYRTAVETFLPVASTTSSAAQPDDLGDVIPATTTKVWLALEIINFDTT
jgi:hypothetical protein